MKTYRVLVDRNLSRKEMVNAGKYDWISVHINPKDIINRRSGLEQVDFEIVYFNKRRMDLFEVDAELAKRNMRQADLVELLAFGAAFPKEQQRRKCSISVFTSDVDCFSDIVCLEANERGRGLMLYGGSSNLERFCFLAVRK